MKTDKTYALLICATLRVVTFRFEEELQDAITAIRKRSGLYVAMKWNDRVKTYVPQEEWS